MTTITRLDENTGTEISINYEAIGDSGETIVFHHGNGNSIEDWHILGFVDALKAKHKLILIDSRGYGKSSKLYDPKEYNLKSRADDIISVLDHEGIDQVHSLGASVGASTCFLLARFYPKRFKSYIFATPYFTLFNQAVKDEIAKGVEAYVFKLEQLMGRPFNNPAIRKIFLSNDPLALLAANSSEWFNYQDYIQYITVPTLIYVGSLESSVNDLNILSKMIEKNSGHQCKFHIYPAMDHASIYWAGKTVAPLIAEFVSQTIDNLYQQ